MDKRQFKAHRIVLSACSSVFKSIINDLPHNNSVIYLKGIQYQEMESILEFMYLGVATFHQERMNEFLNVAISLEIKEISRNVDFDNQNAYNEKQEISDNKTNLEAQSQTNTVVDSKRDTQLIDYSQIQRTSKEGFHCEQCESVFTQKTHLITHIQSIHEGVKYTCNQCHYQATQQSHLTTHIKSIHDGVKYPCNQCDYQATQRCALRRHVKSKHL